MSLIAFVSNRTVEYVCTTDRRKVTSVLTGLVRLGWGGGGETATKLLILVLRLRMRLSCISLWGNIVVRRRASTFIYISSSSLELCVDVCLPGSLHLSDTPDCIR